MIVPANPRGDTVRISTNGKYRRISFSKSIVHGSLKGMDYVAIDLEMAKRTMRFIACDVLYNGIAAHKLTNKRSNRYVSLRIDQLEGVPDGRYRATISDDSVMIAWPNTKGSQ